MKLINNEHIALVLGMFETGLGVARALGRNKIRVIGIDFKNDIGKYSKYVKFKKCPHPKNSNEFIKFLLNFGEKYEKKPVLFITSDDFIIPISDNKNLLKKYFLINIPDKIIIDSLSNKYEQYVLSKNAGIPVPKTFKPKTNTEIELLVKEESFPLFIKAINVNTWREKIGGSIKGFVVNNPQELKDKFDFLKKNNIKFIIQEVIQGPDTNHFKACFYYTNEGEPLCEFTLKKIRQNPVFFGVGSVVESIKYQDLIKSGRQLFDKIKYKGVGSAEFKLDKKDNTLKLIELNARYWQQISLPGKCGINFPLIHYLDVTDQKPQRKHHFSTGIKWINIYMDFNSFIKYRKLGMITLSEWIKSLKKPRVFSDFSWDDIMPFFYEINFGLKILAFPFKFLFKNK